MTGYLGSGGRFDEAIAQFAVAYADQTDKDYGTFIKAIRAKRLPSRSDAVRERVSKVERQRIFSGNQARRAPPGDVQPRPL